MSTPFIICDNLVKIYKVAGLEVVALRGLDMVVHQGELMAIVGASGSGKSTLMNILGGLDRPSAGRVWVSNHDLLKMSDTELNRYRRTEVGFVWQQSARNLVPYLNALENVRLPMTLAGITGKQAKQWAEFLLETVGLAERRKHYLPELSGGEQQRVAIAVALANKPSLLLADEPTGELDSVTALAIYDTLRDLNTELNVTIVIVSHDPEVAKQVERVVALSDGTTARETVRQRNQDHQSDEDEQPEVFEELVVLDSAGRIQIPQDYLEQLNIKGRAKVEVTDQSILILPAPVTEYTESTATPVSELIPKKKEGRLQKLFGRFLRKKDGAEEEKAGVEREAV